NPYPPQFSVWPALKAWQANAASYVYPSNASSTFWMHPSGGPPYGPSPNGDSFPGPDINNPLIGLPTDTQTFSFPYADPYVPAGVQWNVTADVAAWYTGALPNYG